VTTEDFVLLFDAVEHDEHVPDWLVRRKHRDALRLAAGDGLQCRKALKYGRRSAVSGN
jgi:hypothetical protein